MANVVSACGIECDTCPFFKKTCDGCYLVKGHPFWVEEHLGGNPCPIYGCAVDTRALSSCAHCSELPCQKFFDLKEPSVSQEEHIKGIEKRVKTLGGTLSKGN
jgi:hypothetical protein